MRDNAVDRNFILQVVGLTYPIHTMLPMTRGLWLMGNINESDSIMDISGQARTLTTSAISTIAFDARTTNTSSADRNTVTYSHSCSGTNRGLLVFVGHLDADPRSIDTVTYNGVSMTKEGTVTKTFAGGQVRCAVFSLIAPATGANDVVVTWSTNVIASWVCAISYTGVNQSDLVDATNSATGVSNSPSVTVTTVTNNSYIVAGYTFFGGDGDPSAPDDTERWDIATGTSVLVDCTSAGGDVLVPTAGADTVSMTANASDDWAMFGVELKAASSGAAAFGVDTYMPYAVLDGAINWNRADEAGFDITDGLTMGIWKYFDNTASVDEFTIGKWTENGNERSYALKRDSSGNIVAMVSSNGTAETTQASTDIVAAATWALCILRYDPSSELSVFLGQNGGVNGALVEDVNTTSIPASLNSGAADFTIGARDVSATPADFMTGRAGGFAFLCNAVLSDNYLNQLFSQSRDLLDV